MNEQATYTFWLPRDKSTICTVERHFNGAYKQRTISAKHAYYSDELMEAIGIYLADKTQSDLEVLETIWNKAKES